MDNKQMDQSIYSIVEALADEHGFDADEAMELVAEQVEALKALMKPAKVEKAEKPAKEEGDAASKLRHNIALWTKKLEAGDYKDKEAHEAKIAKEQAKLDKLEPKPKEEPKPKGKGKAKEPEAKPEVKAKEPKPEVKEKRIKRMSPILAGQLAKALETAGVKMTEELKKEFANTFVENLSDEDYKSQSVADHMRDFANTKRGGGGGGSGPESAPVSKMTLKALQGVSLDGESVGPDGMVFFAGGKLIAGPDAVADEDIEETEWKGVTYGVGVKSGRVYETVEGRDVLVGWAGVGKFFELPKP